MGEQQVDFSKTLDTVIKAPLWLFFAAMLFTGIPMFNIPNLVGAGVHAEMKIAGMPLALFALASAALFVSSAVARTLPFVLNGVGSVVDAGRWRNRLNSLPPESRSILAMLEKDGCGSFYYDPQSDGLNTLRDAGFVSGADQEGCVQSCAVSRRARPRS